MTDRVEKVGFHADQAVVIPAVDNGQIATHTPGPWKACGTIYKYMSAEIRSGPRGNGQGLAQVWDGPNGFRDAQLMAAAPDLLAALKHYTCSCEPGHCAMSLNEDDTPAEEMLCGRIAQHAIAKATGAA